MRNFESFRIVQRICTGLEMNFLHQVNCQKIQTSVNA